MTTFNTTHRTKKHWPWSTYTIGPSTVWQICTQTSCPNYGLFDLSANSIHHGAGTSERLPGQKRLPDSRKATRTYMLGQCSLSEEDAHPIPQKEARHSGLSLPQWASSCRLSLNTRPGIHCKYGQYMVMPVPLQYGPLRYILRKNYGKVLIGTPPQNFRIKPRRKVHSQIHKQIWKHDFYRSGWTKRQSSQLWKTKTLALFWMHS